jgi:hypothetical protein
MMALWPDELKPGTWWTCRECGAASELSLCVGIRSKEEPPRPAE